MDADELLSGINEKRKARSKINVDNSLRLIKQRMEKSNVLFFDGVTKDEIVIECMARAYLLKYMVERQNETTDKLEDVFFRTLVLFMEMDKK